MRERSISAVGVVLAVLIPVFLGGIWFTLAIALFAGIALKELYQMFATTGSRPQLYCGLLLGSLFFLLAFYDGPTHLWLLLIILAILLPLCSELFRSQHEKALLNWVFTSAGILYIPFLAAHFVLLRLHPPVLPGGLILSVANPLSWLGGNFIVWSYGLRLTLAVFVGTWLNDSGAYLVGKSIGRHKMSPQVSPNKTWEGTIGGIIAAMLSLVALNAALPFVESAGLAALMGFFLGFLGTIGDLVESLLKRQTKVKDSGTLIPGHGGMLDRLDSLLFNVVVVYYFISLTGLP